MDLCTVAISYQRCMKGLQTFYDDCVAAQADDVWKEAVNSAGMDCPFTFVQACAHKLLGFAARRSEQAVPFFGSTEAADRRLWSLLAG